MPVQSDGGIMDFAGVPSPEEVSMNVQDILARKSSNTVRSIEPERSVEEAVARLVEHNIGSLVVMEGGRPVGILTERDILRCCALLENWAPDQRPLLR